MMAKNKNINKNQEDDYITDEESYTSEEEFSDDD